jgi:hypothetical protein
VTGHVSGYPVYAKITKREDGCWEWTASRFPNGYGQFVAAGEQYAHRVAFLFVAQQTIPARHQLDHLCRNKACVNPDHLEAVTHRVNTLRGDTMPGRNSRKTHCVHGHEFTPENTTLSPYGRRCKTCDRRRSREAYARRKAAVA